MKKTCLYAATLSAILFGTTALAADVMEEEPNQPIYNAQALSVDIEMAVYAVLGDIGGGNTTDLDFYSFYGQADDVVTVDIDGGMGGAQSVDTVIAIFGPGPYYQMLRLNDDATSIDPGSTHRFDSRIDNFHLPATGRYYVGVSNYPRYFQNGGVVTNATRGASGDYTLVITGVSPDVQMIDIEVKPGNHEWAPINPKSRGKIPVAILSTGSFDARNVDLTTLTFGSTGDEASLSHCGKSNQDFNNDGRLDVMCHFNNQDASFNYSDIEGILRGATTDGTRIEGRAPLKMVPQKQQ
ncbi:MAG: PPC domain-containing protein [Gammaproteobacteria bacterium]|nr:PPC domain-containing protein [Gammaproteobacteria bacterium]